MLKKWMTILCVGAVVGTSAFAQDPNDLGRRWTGSDTEGRNAPEARSDGVGVGGGGTDQRNAYLERMQWELRRGEEDPGTRLRLDRAGYEDLLSWSDRVIVILRRERSRASVQYHMERYALAEQILVDAIRTLNHSIEGEPEAGPLTRRLLRLGLVISTELRRVLNRDPVRDSITRVEVLLRFTNFIIESHRQLDRPLYIPYRYRWDGNPPADCPEFNMGEFQRKYVQFVADVLAFVPQNLTQVGADRWGRQAVFSVGHPHAFLKVAEIVCDFAAYHLYKMAFSDRYSVVIFELQQLGSDLANFVDYGDRSVFLGYSSAMVTAREELLRISAFLSGTRRE